MHKQTLLVTALLSVVLLSGCINDDGTGNDDSPGTGSAVTDVFERFDLPFNTSDVYSHTLEGGPYAILDALSVDVQVDLDPSEGGAAIDPVNPPRIHMGVFLPDVPEGTKVPVIADVGPYYNDLDVPATERGSGRLGEFLIENFVPHGYAVAQVSVFGSGSSNHCFDMMGTAEQAGVHAAVEHLGTAEWSSGSVGLIGRSYDGSTPWEAAAMGSEHLKTIVPISGLIGIPELMFNNGAPETRTALFHNYVYGQFGIDSAHVDPFGSVPDGLVTVNDPDLEDRHNVCPDYLASSGYQTSEIAAQGYAGYNQYFEERRFFDRALENYGGSVYLIHGLQDWNVDPHAAMPYFPQMQDRWETKGLFGQWDHAYPDRPSDHSDLGPGRGEEAGNWTVRYDWAQDLLEWFDHYLMGEGAKPDLHVEVQDHLGTWRVEDTWPPQDADTMELSLADADGPASFTYTGRSGEATYDFGALSDTQDIIITGLPEVHAQVTLGEPRGLLYAELRDATDDVRLGHGIVDVRYHKGSMDAPDDPTPSGTIDVMVRFEAMEARVPAGHSVTLTLAGSGEGYTLNRNEAEHTVSANGSTFGFQYRTPDQIATFLPPEWAGTAGASA